MRVYVDLPPEIIFIFMLVYVRINAHKHKILNAQRF